MRITNTMLMHRAIRDLDKLREQYARAQDAVNGRVLTRPSDDPKRVEEAMQLSGMELRMERIQRAAEDALDWLRVTETHLTAIIDRLQAAREAVVQAGGPLALGPEGQQSLAATLRSIRESLMQELNSQHRGLYLFSGYKTDTRPFVESGGTLQYQGGPDQELVRTVAPGFTVAVTVPGNWLHADEVIGALDQMIADLEAGNIENLTATGLPALDKALENLTVIRSDLGLRQNQVTQYMEQARDSILLIKERLTKISGGDLETAVLEMTEAQTAYLAALACFAKALPQSLIDYMLR
ncbi:MAG TPA: flagellin [Symbiobacteriaceae bacterium]